MSLLHLPATASKVALATLAGLSLAGGAAVVAFAAPGPISSAVKNCQAELTTGEHGIGGCVSKIAASHSPEASPNPSPSTLSSPTDKPSPSATPFGQLVKKRVADCKAAARAAGAHGIGGCVSPFASSHGADTTMPTFTAHSGGHGAGSGKGSGQGH